MSKNRGMGTSGPGGSRPYHTKGGCPRQHCEQLCIRLACRCKRPGCVGKILHVEVAHTPLCCPRERCEQLCIRLARRRKRPCRVGKILHVEVAHTPICCPRQHCEQLCIRLACRCNQRNFLKLTKAGLPQKEISM